MPPASDRFRLDGRIALVTGASRGLGRAMATALAAAGADVAVHGREQRAESTAQDVAALGRRAVCVTADLTDPANADRLVDETVAAFGRLDILINNAGL